MTTGSGPLSDPARLYALLRTGLAAAPDPAFDRYAALVRKILGVPVALVSLVDDARQFFPGAAGLAEPWAQSRSTDLDHSFCRHVILSARPLVVTDARADGRVCDNLAIADLGVIAYAGMPLTDEDGHILGSLCAIDDRPRNWTDTELDLLADLATACSAELRLRIAADHARQSHREAELLLRASASMLDTSGVDDVVGAVAGLAGSGLGAGHVAVLMRDERPARLTVEVSGTARPSAAAPPDRPDTAALRDRRAVFLADRAEIVAAFPHLAEECAQRGWHALACAPLIGAAGPLGTLRFAWDAPHPFDVGERAVITALAGYVTQALERALRLDAQVAVAEILQRSMLSPLPPAAAGYQLAAHYQPGAAGKRIGGDWYDAVAGVGGHLTLVIGDVAGHDMSAAAKMGQLRSMLRAYLVDRHEPPSALLRRLDAANHTLGDRTVATALVAFVGQAADGTWRLQWSNAGHPAPLLVHPDGRVEELPGGDLLLGVRQLTPRRNHTRTLPPGSTLLLYTDGLVETRTDTVDDGTARLSARLGALAGAPLDALVRDVIAASPGGYPDDVAVLALRLSD
jgi:GAF domain-containing protein